MPTRTASRQRQYKSRQAKSVQGEVAAKVSERLAGLDKRYLDCRELKHSYERLGYYTEGSIRVRLTQCVRCTTRVRLRQNAQGKIISRRYEYPEGYLLKGSNGVSAQDVRLVAMGIAKIYNSEDALMAAVLGGRRKP